MRRTYHSFSRCIGRSNGDAGVLPDDFEMRAREVLGEQNPKLLADLLALRSDTTRFAAQKWPGFAPPSAECLIPAISS